MFASSKRVNALENEIVSLKSKIRVQEKDISNLRASIKVEKEYRAHTDKDLREKASIQLLEELADALGYHRVDLPATPAETVFEKVRDDDE